MRTARRDVLALVSLALACVLAVSARAQPVTMDDLAAAVVQVKAHINPDGRTAETLGLERKGSGIVIGSNGLVLTIGYIIVEAHAVEVTSSRRMRWR